MLTLDGKGIDIELDVNRVCLNDEERGNSFIIDPDNQYRAVVMGKPDYWIQPIVEWCAFPVVTNTDKAQNFDNFKTIVNQLFKDAYQVTASAQFRKAKNTAMTAFLWGVSIVCSTILIIAFIEWRSRG